MNKSEFIAALAATTGLTKADIGKVVDAIPATIAAPLKSGDTVTVPGFGTFSLRQREARTGRNPSTGEQIQIAASKSPGFKAGKGFKDLFA